MAAPQTITLAWTGASGLAYGLRLLECLVAADRRVFLLYSAAAQIVAKQECDLALPAQPREATRFFTERHGAQAGQITVFGREDWMAPVASGSNPADAMAICPCTMGTLAAVACGLADNLIARAADVMLKERRPLVLVPRETPLSTIHLDNMLGLHLVIGNARGGHQEALGRPDAHIAGGALVDPFLVHPETGVDHRFAEVEVLELGHVRCFPELRSGIGL